MTVSGPTGDSVTTDELDLGHFNGPLLVFGGPYSNLQALDAVLREAGRRNIEANHVICTGDVVAYGADPAACLQRVRETGITVLMGNCEESLAAGAADCGCGFDEGSACDLLSRQWYALADREVDTDQRRWMGVLPRQLRFTLGRRRFVVTHGAPDGINRFLFRSAPDWSEKARLLRAVQADAIIGGHCGLPFLEQETEGLWLNAGAIGLPANDGTPRGWFALLTPRADGIAIDLEPLRYDHAGAAARMHEAGLDSGYRQTLLDGLWPSQDVLPPAEKAERGRPLSARRFFWSDAAPARTAA